MKTNRRPRTDDENVAISQMACVRFPVGSWDKRFYRSISSVDTITEKEAAQLWRLFIRYRKQVRSPDKGRLLALAEKLAAPDFRKLEAARKAQTRINEMREERLAS